MMFLTLTSDASNLSFVVVILIIHIYVYINEFNLEQTDSSKVILMTINHILSKH